ncbi:MAG: DUF86 domain-containing protein [Prevotella sp.]|nr:DUF86 domain-containing protein [Prevotella sp.]
MFDQELALSSLAEISSAVETILQRTENISCADDFVLSPGGMLRLDAVCMNLIAIGEAVKGLDKITQKEFLPKYPQIYWKGVMKMRDKIAHHYFEIDADVVYNTIHEDIPKLYETIQQMINDLKKQHNG